MRESGRKYKKASVAERIALIWRTFGPHRVMGYAQVTFSRKVVESLIGRIDNLRVGGKVSPLGRVLDRTAPMTAPRALGSLRAHLVKVRLGKTVLCFTDEMQTA